MPPPTDSQHSQSSPESTDRAVQRTIDRFHLLTHCGIVETRVGNDYYRATPPMKGLDGLGPPAGWDDPFEVGRMTTFSDGTARFNGPSGHNASLVLRPEATSFNASG